MKKYVYIVVGEPRSSGGDLHWLVVRVRAPFVGWLAPAPTAPSPITRRRSTRSASAPVRLRKRRIGVRVWGGET